MVNENCDDSNEASVEVSGGNLDITAVENEEAMDNDFEEELPKASVKGRYKRKKTETATSKGMGFSKQAKDPEDVI